MKKERIREFCIYTVKFVLESISKASFSLCFSGITFKLRQVNFADRAVINLNVLSV